MHPYRILAAKNTRRMVERLAALFGGAFGKQSHPVRKMWDEGSPFWLVRRGIKRKTAKFSTSPIRGVQPKN